MTEPMPISKAMSEKQLKAFLEAVKADAALQEKLNAVGDADSVVSIAKAAGFAISAEEYQASQEGMEEMELEGVAGGGARRPGRRGVRSGDDDLDELEVERLRAK